MTAIQTHGLTKCYGDVTAIADVDLTVESGEVFGFLGPNGAGKSTTIDVLLDFVRPTSGRAEVLGFDAQRESDAIGHRIGVLPDGFSLYERLSGVRHVSFAIETAGADDDPYALCERVGLDRSDAERPTGGYSKGMTQRLATAMALAGDPELLVMDEPTSGLDPAGIREMQALVREEADRGTTVFFSSHVLAHVERVCDRVGVLHDGRLIAVDTIDGLDEALGGGATVTVELAEPMAEVLETLRAVDGVADVAVSGPVVEATCRVPRAKADTILALEEAGATVRDVSIEETSLESLFATLTETGGFERRPGSDGSTAARTGDRRNGNSTAVVEPAVNS
ncbi:ABC transporter ATP-binding protein [Halovivax gelatinilyticus]|uniref:ABC transporter ATP-binding protein n=1 Tax=Halovivax gelatinilyticus TaxID=2961597 RepID=UPI0020CA4525|nr:ABC transporter ATP-binding protein [Halovivax gelatinilyticus]